jgi:phosphoribosylformimino-5-aminoimidazole carboxamide ribotide isomerase
MQIIPAIDIREGACVQLIGGDVSRERLRVENPEAQLEQFIDYGAERVHVVDLDRALGRGENTELIKSMLKAADGIRIQVGGGIRDLEDINSFLEAGADKIVLGTRAIMEPDWLLKATYHHTGEIIVAIDAKDEDVVVSGWQANAGTTIYESGLSAQENGASGVLYTDVSREGLTEGPNITRTVELAELLGVEVLASGGITTREDISELEQAGADGAVIGTAAYTGSLALNDLFG